VAADSEERARAAALVVKVEYEDLPSYMSFPEAVMPNAIQIQKTLPNFYMENPLLKGKDTEEIFDNAPVVAQGSFHSPRQTHLPIEPDTLQGYYESDGTLTIQCKAQSMHDSLHEISDACGIPIQKLRLINNPAGGSFGYAIASNTYALVATAVQNLGIPCTMTLKYDEFNHMSGKRAASYANGRIACDENGKIQGVEYDIALDHGAYTVVASITFANYFSIGFHGYNIPNIKALARAGSSNNGFNVAYRGFGAPEIYTMSEALIDMAAEKAGIDPFDFRYLNLANPGDTTVNSRPYLNYTSYRTLMDMIKPHYDAYNAEAKKARSEGRSVGVGLGMGGFLVTKGLFDDCELDVELLPDGKVACYSCWQDVGQGGDIGVMAHALKALQPLGLTPDNIRLVLNDTGRAPKHGLSAASRSHYMAGNAMIDAANKLMAAMKKSDGSFRTYDEMIAENIPVKHRGHYDQMHRTDVDPELDPNTGEGARNAEFMYAVNLALVEVDEKTGKTKVLKYTTTADVGTVGNRLSVDGQAYGGLSHSIGFALSEDYNAEDKHGSMVGCGIPTVDMIPDELNVYYLETPRPHGPHGSSGCSENFQASGHMAVINAISNACGVRIYDLPATPDKVRAALEKKEKGEDMTPPKYYLGPDFEDELEFIKNNPV